MSDEIVSDSQIDNDVEEVFQDDSQEFDIREAFGLPAKEEESEEGEQSVNDETPAIEEVVTESKKRVVKFNKEDREIAESEVDELLQMGLALPKQRERVTEYEKALERAAKLAGFESHEELIANLDRMEQNKVKQAEDAFNTKRQAVIDQLIYNGVDEDAAIEFADNNPLMQEARQTLEEKKQAEQARVKDTVEQGHRQQWGDFYSKHPDLREAALKMPQGQEPEWYTPQIQGMVSRGLTPLEAFTLLNIDQIKTITTKQTEQKLIKQQQLSSRSKVTEAGEQENRASEELKGAFAMFGIDPKRAQKYAK